MWSVCRLLLRVALTATALASMPATASAAELFYTVGPQNRLLTFTSDAPAALAGGVPIYGLQPGERILGLDVRPDTEELFGVGSTSRIYRINPGSGRALLVGPGAFPTTLQSKDIGIDFNPVADRLRVVSETDQNLRINPNDGTVTTDGRLAYAADDVAAGVNPHVTASAYTDNTAQSTTTTLFGIDDVRGTLVRQDPPNAGTLRTVGKLTIADGEISRIVGPVGFDIASNTVAYVSFRQADNLSAAGLYRLDLRSGELDLLGFVGPLVTGLRVSTTGLAAAGQVPDDQDAPLVVAAAPESQRLDEVARRGLRFELSCNETCGVSARVTQRDRTLARAEVALLGAGKARLRFVLRPLVIRALRRSTSRRVALELVITDAAGNRQRQRENVTLVP